MDPPRDGDARSREDEMIAEVIPLRRRTRDGAPMPREAGSSHSGVFDPPPDPEPSEEYSVWERPTAELVRREPPESPRAIASRGAPGDRSAPGRPAASRSWQLRAPCSCWLLMARIAARRDLPTRAWAAASSGSGLRSAQGQGARASPLPVAHGHRRNGHAVTTAQPETTPREPALPLGRRTRLWPRLPSLPRARAHPKQPTLKRPRPVRDRLPNPRALPPRASSDSNARPYVDDSSRCTSASSIRRASESIVSANSVTASSALSSPIRRRRGSTRRPRPGRHRRRRRM